MSDSSSSKLNANSYVGLIIAAAGLFYVFKDDLSGYLGLTLSTHSLTYSVSGSSDVANVTYGNETGGFEEEEVHLPWSKTFTAKNGWIFYLLAQNPHESGAISARADADGNLVKQSSSKGAFVSAQVTGLCCEPADDQTPSDPFKSEATASPTASVHHTIQSEGYSTADPGTSSGAQCALEYVRLMTAQHYDEALKMLLPENAPNADNAYRDIYTGTVAPALDATDFRVVDGETGPLEPTSAAIANGITGMETHYVHFIYKQKRSGLWEDEAYHLIVTKFNGKWFVQGCN